MAILTPGELAPDFELPDQDGKMVRLSEFRGRRVVVYFYPKDNTSGCTREACAFGAAHPHFESLGIPVLGISKDSQASHRRFADKHSLPFTLLSDPELTAIQAFGVWQEKKLYGKVSMGVVRSTFLIGSDGKVEQVWPKAKPDTNAQEILDYLQKME